MSLDATGPGGPGLHCGFPGGVNLSLRAPHVQLADGPLPAAGRWVRSHGRVKGRGGPAERVEWQQLTGGVSLRWCVEIPRDGSGVAARVCVENRTPRPVHVERLIPLRVVSAAHLEAGPWEMWEAWQDGPRNFSAPPGRGLVGFTTASCGGQALAADAGLLRAEQVPEAAWLAAGASLESDRAWLGVGDTDTGLAEAWAQRSAQEMRVQLLRPAVHWPAANPSPALPHVDPLPLWSAQQPPAEKPGREVRLARAPARLAAVGRTQAQEGSPLALAPGAGRLWLVAPSPLDLAGGDLESVTSQAALAALGGGLVRLAAPPDGLPGERLALARRMLPPLGRPCQRVGEHALATQLVGGRLALWLGNASQAERPLGMDLAALGLAGPVHGFDFLAGEPLGLLRDQVPERLTPAGGCRVIGLTPAADRPLVIGTTLHVGMGTLEVAALRIQAHEQVLVLRHPGAHHGSVWIANPGVDTPRCVEVAFQDQALVPVL